MAVVAITSLAALGAAPATNDLLVLVDVSNTAMSANGTDVKMTVANLFTAPTISNPVVTGTITTPSLLITGTQINETATNGLSNIAINFDGYASGTTQFRDFYVYNGKEAQVLKLTGSSKLAEFAGAVTMASTLAVTGVLTGGASMSVTSAAQSQFDLIKTGANANTAYWYNDGVSVGLLDATNARLLVNFTRSTQLAAFPAAVTVGGTLGVTGLTTLGGGTLLATSTALTNGAAAAAGTLLNAPAAGNPTKWIPINDNGTTRYIPAW